LRFRVLTDAADITIISPHSLEETKKKTTAAADVAARADTDAAGYAAFSVILEEEIME